MTRISTLTIQSQFQATMVRQQQEMSETVVKVSTGKKVATYADIGADTGRVLTARSMLTQIEAQRGITDRVATSLSLYQARLSEMDQATSTLRAGILDAIGTGNAPTLIKDAEATFAQFRAAMNAADDGLPIFAGSRTDEQPLKAERLADVAGLDPDAAFTSDEVARTARVTPGLDLSYGIDAKEFGKKFIAAFRTIAELGTLPPRPTQAQLDKLAIAKAQLDEGLVELRSVDARNGRAQNRVDEIVTRAEDRKIVLTSAVSEVEDANAASVETELLGRKKMLEASLNAYAMLNSISLSNYLT